MFTLFSYKSLDAANMQQISFELGWTNTAGWWCCFFFALDHGFHSNSIYEFLYFGSWIQRLLMMSYFHPFRNCMQHILICAWASYLATKRHRAVFLERMRKKVVQRETKPAKRRIPWRFSVWFSAFLSRPLTITSSSKTKTNVSNPFVTCALIYATKRDKTSSTSNRLSTHVIHRFALEQQHINFWSVYSISTIL